MSSKLKISGLVKESIVDGPGIRYVVFTQGCLHRCEGCHNPQTHDPEGGSFIDIDSILEDVKKNPLLDGITLSGGEPFLQPEALCELSKKVKELNMNIISYTGYTFDQLLEISKNKPEVYSLLENVDILIDGRFEISQRNILLKFRGSENQRIIDVKKSLQSGNIIELDW